MSTPRVRFIKGCALQFLIAAASESVSLQLAGLEDARQLVQAVLVGDGYKSGHWPTGSVPGHNEAPEADPLALKLLRVSQITHALKHSTCLRCSPSGRCQFHLANEQLSGLIRVDQFD